MLTDLFSYIKVMSRMIYSGVLILLIATANNLSSNVWKNNCFNPGEVFVFIFYETKLC